MNRTDELIKEILDNMNMVADTPCVNTVCAFCDGNCAQAGCGGYMDKYDKKH